jgi:hypothetical protein
MRRERIFNPLEIYDDLKLIDRFRFERRTNLQITQLLQDDLESSTFRNKAIPPLIKVLISLRCFASGSFQIIIVDTFNVDQSTVSRAVHSVYNALVRRSHRFIQFPIAQGIAENKRKCYDIGNFPNIFGLIDDTPV